MTYHLKIAICGAGPVSLTLANTLQNNNIPFTIYEAAPEIRTQGGSLDLHPQSGQLALKEAGLWDHFKQYARPESDVLKIVRLDGEVLWDGNSADKQEVKEEEKFNGRPEIDRRALMKLLYENLNKNSIVFGKKLRKVVPSETAAKKYDLHFADNTTAPSFDLVIGSDGAWSKVRTLLSDTKPRYSGISMVAASLNNIRANPWLTNYVGEGSMFSFGSDMSITSQRGDNGYLLTYASLRVPEDFLETCGIDWTDAVTARKEYMEKYFSHISPDLKRVFLASIDDLTPRPLYELPVGFSWAPRSGVTLVGDAAHVMTPFAGVGVNVGMTDALVLGREIIDACKGGKTLDEAIKAYEEEMVPRAAKFAQKTLRGKENHFSKDGAKEFADMLRAHHDAPKAVQGSWE
ncbi:monooxygenase [Macroventuria anomochaeta]|uniref:Monooxygenase n=1 Tax=Macroventuria anomochaeta TaxID=301207 RepID=A0ACB6RZR4_9PLEO|nr:monooxygenase [Macroventuria anomochaeta]KAF2626905.1 monooxygenase [Macroventuria anomochaeta]